MATEPYPNLISISRPDIEIYADKLFSLGIGHINTISGRDQADLIIASRIIRRLLAAFERGTGRELASLLITEQQSEPELPEVSRSSHYS